MQRRYTLLVDPLFYIMVAFFAALTTGLAAALGQPRFLPISQTAALFAFLFVALRQREIRPPLLVMAIWLGVQVITLAIVTRMVPGQVEQAISNGFFYRGDFIGWFYGPAETRLPMGLLSQPVARMVELGGIVLGSLLTGGLVGVWFVVRAANLGAYSAGVLWQDSGLLFNLFAGLPIWTLLRLAGSAGLVVLLAEPLMSGNWSLRYYVSHRRALLVTSSLLLGAGLVLELLLPNLWRNLFA